MLVRRTCILIVDDLPEKHLAYEAMLAGIGAHILSRSIREPKL